MNDPTPNTPPPNGPVSSGGFDFNRPTIIAALYLASFLAGGVTGIIGIVLAFVWKGEAHAGWEDSHYQYLINTFWIGLIGTVVGFLLMIVLIGFLILAVTCVVVIVRSVLVIVNAQKQQPMPNPGSWII